MDADCFIGSDVLLEYFRHLSHRIYSRHTFWKWIHHASTQKRAFKKTFAPSKAWSYSFGLRRHGYHSFDCFFSNDVSMIIWWSLFHFQPILVRCPFDQQTNGKPQPWLWPCLCGTSRPRCTQRHRHEKRTGVLVDEFIHQVLIFEDQKWTVFDHFLFSAYSQVTIAYSSTYFPHFRDEMIWSNQDPHIYDDLEGIWDFWSYRWMVWNIITVDV